MYHQRNSVDIHNSAINKKTNPHIYPRISTERCMFLLMQKFVSLEVTVLCKTSVAHFTEKSFLIRVIQLVHAEVVGPRESFATNIASVRELASMHANMNFQIAGLCEGPLTEFTNIRTLSGMHSHVDFQDGVTRESIVADFTDWWTIICIRPPMLRCRLCCSLKRTKTAPLSRVEL